MHVLLQPLQTCAEDTAYRTEQRIFAARLTEVRRRNRNARRARLGEGFDRMVRACAARAWWRAARGRDRNAPFVSDRDLRGGPAGR